MIRRVGASLNCDKDENCHFAKPAPCRSARPGFVSARRVGVRRRRRATLSRVAAAARSADSIYKFLAR